MINTLGGRFGGHGLYLLKGKPVFVYNFFDLERFRWEGPAALAPGKHTVVFDFKYDGPGFGKGGTGVLSVDGKEVASKTIPHTMPFLETIDETFDVGMDTRTGVDDKDYQPPFRFTGKIDKLTVKLVPLSAAEEKLLQQKAQETEERPSKSLRLCCLAFGFLALSWKLLAMSGLDQTRKSSEPTPTSALLRSAAIAVRECQVSFVAQSRP